MTNQTQPTAPDPFKEFSERLRRFAPHRKTLEEGIEGFSITSGTGVPEAVDLLSDKIKTLVAPYLGVNSNAVEGRQANLEYVPQWETLKRLIEKAKKTDGSYNMAKIAEELADLVQQIAEGKTVNTLSSMNPTGNGRQVIKGWANTFEPFNTTGHTPDQLADKVLTQEQLMDTGKSLYQAHKGVENTVERTYKQYLN